MEIAKHKIYATVISKGSKNYIIDFKRPVYITYIYTKTNYFAYINLMQIFGLQ